MQVVSVIDQSLASAHTTKPYVGDLVMSISGYTYQLWPSVFAFPYFHPLNHDSVPEADLRHVQDAPLASVQGSTPHCSIGITFPFAHSMCDRIARRSAHHTHRNSILKV